MNTDFGFLRNLRTVGLIEGTSTLVLFGIAMPMKYLGGMPMAVTVVGTIHGILFLALVVMFLVGMKRIPISRQLTAAGIAGAVVPFGPFVVDRWLVRMKSED